VSKARALLAVALMTATSSCSVFEPQSYKQCEAFIQNKLKTPATYKRVSAEGISMKDGTQYWVHITYDAQNEYGALVRGQYICQYPAFRGQADTFNYIDFDQAYQADADNIDATADNLTSVAD
jgi:hypothetical protein